MYNVPTPDEYKKQFEATQEKIMGKFITDVNRSLQSGLDKLNFEFPEELSIGYCSKVKEIFEKKGWKVKYSGINSRHLILII